MFQTHISGMKAEELVLNIADYVALKQFFFVDGPLLPFQILCSFQLLNWITVDPEPLPGILLMRCEHTL